MELSEWSDDRIRIRKEEENRRQQLIRQERIKRIRDSGFRPHSLTTEATAYLIHSCLNYIIDSRGLFPEKGSVERFTTYFEETPSLPIIYLGNRNAREGAFEPYELLVLGRHPNNTALSIFKANTDPYLSPNYDPTLGYPEAAMLHPVTLLCTYEAIMGFKIPG